MQQHRSVLGSQPSVRVRGKQGYSMLLGIKQLLLWCVTPFVAAAVGAVAYALLLVVLLLALLWAWITRTVFSVYCIFFPCAADTPCCLKLTRTGDFWSMSDIQATFKAARSHMHSSWCLNQQVLIHPVWASMGMMPAAVYVLHTAGLVTSP